MDVDELNENNVVPILGSRSLKKKNWKKTSRKRRCNTSLSIASNIQASEIP